MPMGGQRKGWAGVAARIKLGMQKRVHQHAPPAGDVAALASCCTPLPTACTPQFLRVTSSPGTRLVGAAAPIEWSAGSQSASSCAGGT